MRTFYRKTDQSVSIEAGKVGTDPIENIANWCGGQIVEEKDALTGDPSEGLNVKTSTGRRRASKGEYIVKVGEQFIIISGLEFERLYTTEEKPRPRSEAEDPSPPVERLINDPFEGMTRFNDGPKP